MRATTITTMAGLGMPRSLAIADGLALVGWSGRMAAGIGPRPARCCGSVVTAGVPQVMQYFHSGSRSVEHETQTAIDEC